jgi:putative S-methylcysteine transport system permease protein
MILMRPNFDLMFTLEFIPFLLKTIHITIIIAVSSMIFGLIIGTSLALIRVYRIKGLYNLTSLYISFFRGTPLIVQLFLLYYGLPQIVPVLKHMNAFSAAIIGLSLNSGAYMAETIRGAILSVDKGQMEASLSIGMNPWQAMKRIILPQAARIAIPSLANTFISLLKESSLAFTLGVAEMLARSKMAAAATYRVFESYLAAAVVYWAITIVFSYIQKKIELRVNKAY